MSQDVTSKYEILPRAVSDAAETLLRECERTQAALQAFLSRVQGTGQAQRLAPGVWAVQSVPESFNEMTIDRPGEASNE